MAALLSPAPSPANAPAVRAALLFLKEYWLRVLAISAAVLTPCLWQRHIQAGDLGSHVYNAWLAQLIAQGQAPGLYIVRQWNNVLFDLLLLHLGNLVGLPAAERISVCAAVLAFFWGAFALVCAIASSIARQVPWRILPGVAMISYGWTFQMGFFNYYISLGLAFFALAILYRGKGWERALALPLAPLIYMAHPLGLALLMGAGAYLLAARSVCGNRQYYLAGGAALVIVSLRLYLAGHYTVLYSGSRYMFNGTDQLFLYGSRYRVLANLLLAFLAACLLADGISRQKSHAGRSADGVSLSAYAVSLQLYGLAFLAALVLPSVIFVPQLAAPVSLLTERLTSVSAVLVFCSVAAARPQKWQLLGFSALAIVFFIFLYQDTSILNNMQDQAQRYERVLPPGQRIVATIWPMAGSRILNGHFIDRSCIGYCFSYGNYEPSSEQFRIRAQSGNPFAVSDADSSDAIQSGNYVIQPHDLPLYQIYQCDLSRTKLCMRELSAGETNGRIGLHLAR
jgi:hypothetical protein